MVSHFGKKFIGLRDDFWGILKTEHSHKKTGRGKFTTRLKGEKTGKGINRQEQVPVVFGGPVLFPTPADVRAEQLPCGT